MKIEALASAFNIPITVHNTQPILSTVAHLHFCAASSMVPYSQEYNIEPISIRDEWPILKEPLEVVDGYIAVPEGPGLGVELDEEMVEAAFCLNCDLRDSGDGQGLGRKDVRMRVWGLVRWDCRGGCRGSGRDHCIHVRRGRTRPSTKRWGSLSESRGWERLRG